MWNPKDGAERFQISHQNSDLYNDKSQVNWKRNLSPVLKSVSVIVWGNLCRAVIIYDDEI